MQKTITPKGDLDCVVQLRINKELIGKLEDIARRNSLPRSALIRLVLSQYVQKQGDKLIRLSDDK